MHTFDLRVAVLLLVVAFASSSVTWAQEYQPYPAPTSSAPPRDNGAIARIMRSHQPLVSEDHETLRSSRQGERVVQAGYSREMIQPQQLPLDPMVGQNTSRQYAARQNLTSEEAPTSGENASPNKGALNFLERESLTRQTTADDKDNNSYHDVGQLVSRIGMNLAFVLFMGIGGVLLAKQWFDPKGKKKARKKAGGAELREDEDSMEVQEVLRLDAKSTLQLIRCGSTQLLVATDSMGIKSVNVLNATTEEVYRSPSMPDESSTENSEGASFESYIDPPTTNVPTEPSAQEKFKVLLNQHKRARQENLMTGPAKSATAAYQSANKSAQSTDREPADAEGIDERLIKMLLENSKKRAAKNAA